MHTDLLETTYAALDPASRWAPELLRAHVVADAVMTLAFFAIPITLVYFLRQRARITREPVRHGWVLWLFAGFITLTGATYLLSLLSLWTPLQELQTGVKLLAALVSMATAISLIPLLPKVLNLKTAEQLEREMKARLRAEQQLAKTVVELRQSNADLEQFAYVASHDLRAPLRNITSFAKLAEAKCRADDADAVKEYLNYVVHGAYRMQSMIDDLLELSRVESHIGDGLSLNCSDVLDEVRANMATLLAETRTRIDFAELPAVRGERTQLVRLLQNLISNAIKFQPPGRRPQIRIHGRVEAGRVLFTVSDNGIGIAERHHQKIFKLFGRLHPDGAYPGTGMGLAICKKIVERQGGRITVESTPGIGSAFHFDLPQADAETTARSRSRPIDLPVRSVAA